MFKVIGVEKCIHPESAMQDIAALWEVFYQKMEEVQGTGMYAVYTDYQGNYMKPYQYLVGKKVKGDYELSEAELRAGLSIRVVPKANYEVVDVKGNMPLALVDKWKMIWSEKEEARTYATDYEEYKTDSEVSIFLGVK